MLTRPPLFLLNDQDIDETDQHHGARRLPTARFYQVIDFKRVPLMIR